MPESTTEPRDPPAQVRPVTVGDLPAVMAIDELGTGIAKPDYWRDFFDRYQSRRRQRFFLVAERHGRVLGFISGEIRAWEFGSPPCGWIVAIDVHPDRRLAGIGSLLFDAICDCFRQAGVDKVRTMLARDAHVIMSFFRGQGMMAGPSIQLEMDLDPGAAAHG
jgi:GNAT superfamily N-acetyltransferase